MISYLKGKIVQKQLDGIILEVNNIGYRLMLSSFETDQLNLDQEFKIYVYENIKEDLYDLYGFLGLDSKQLFEQLISVKNIGPKVAISILGIAQVDVIKSAIAGGEVKFLRTAKGVGQRAAEQIIVELRDKVGLIVNDKAATIINRPGKHNLNDEAVEALISLGYSQEDALSLLLAVDPTLSTEERIKLALKG
jgi:Holliday junction DNA helicase RuvA